MKALAATTQAPAKVYLFLVGEEVFIESPFPKVNVTADDEAGTGSPEDVARRVVLSAVFFHYMKQASAAERIAIPVEETPCRTGILEITVVAFGEQLRLYGC